MRAAVNTRASLRTCFSTPAFILDELVGQEHAAALLQRPCQTTRAARFGRNDLRKHLLDLRLREWAILVADAPQRESDPVLVRHAARARLRRGAGGERIAHRGGQVPPLLRKLRHLLSVARPCQALPVSTPFYVMLLGEGSKARGNTADIPIRTATGSAQRRSRSQQLAPRDLAHVGPASREMS